MRLKEIQNILTIINFEKARIISSPSKTHEKRIVLDNIVPFKMFLKLIKPIGIYDLEIVELENSLIYETTSNTLEMDVAYAIELFNLAEYLVNSSLSLVLVFKTLLPSSKQDSISVKLPEPSDFEALVGMMRKLQKSLSQVVVHKEIEGSVNINNWEFGSYWLELFLGSLAAVKLVSSIAWSAAVVTKKHKENKIFEKTLKTMDIKNESLKDLLDSQKKMTRQLIERETDSVVKKHFKDNDPEHIKRVESTIKTFAELIQKGAEIQPSLMAPEDIKNLFPNYKKIESITSKIKLLEKSPEDSEEKNSDLV